MTAPPHLLLMLDRHLGNFLVASPVLCDWAARQPQTRSVIDQSHEALAARIPGFPEPIAIYQGSGSAAKRLRSFLRVMYAVRGHNAGTLAEFGGSRTGSRIGAWSGAEIRICRAGEPLARHYNLHAPRGRPGAHRVETYGELARTAGVDAKWRQPRLHSTPADRNAIRSNRLIPPEPFVCLHVAGGKSYKHWPRAHFARLADELERQGLRVVLIGGPADREAVDEVTRLSRTVSIDLAGKIPIGQLIALLEEARLFIGNDSGPMHLAAAAGTHVVALFGPTDPARWRPLTDRLTLIRGNTPAPPDEGKKNFPDGRRMDSITVDTVLKALEPHLPGPLTATS